MAKKTEFRLKDGSMLCGTIIAKALHVVIIKVRNTFYLVDKDKIKKDSENEQLTLKL